MDKKNDLLSRKALLAELNNEFRECEQDGEENGGEAVLLAEGIESAIDTIKRFPAIKITGETSDGYHTFNELYRHRGILFALICADHQEIAWKSRKHHDGTMYPDMFICGIDTPYGQATYHMDIQPFWDMIKARELPAAPEWDGHTPDTALNRIAAMAMDRFIPLEGGVVED